MPYMHSLEVLIQLYQKLQCSFYMAFYLERLPVSAISVLQQHVNDLLPLIHIPLKLSHILQADSIDFLLM